MQGEYDIIDLSRPIHTNMPVFPAIRIMFRAIFTHDEPR
jgi:kynurenine formamidase